MITVVSGVLGGGKSYDCVRLIREHLDSGGCVRTNIRLDWKQMAASLGRMLRPWQIGTLSAESDPKLIPIGDRRGHGKRRTLVVLDEALNWFQSTQGKDERKKDWSEWLRQSDKLGQDVWFIAQNFERTAKWIRELAQVSREVVKLGDLKFLFIRLKWILPFTSRAYLVVTRDVRTGGLMGSRIGFYSPRIWRLYDTSETFGFDAAESAYIATVPPKFTLPKWPFVVGLGFWLFMVFFF